MDLNSFNFEIEKKKNNRKKLVEIGSYCRQ